jgi:ATP-dependent Clp protease ATP-binding subunit ClpA
VRDGRHYEQGFDFIREGIAGEIFDTMVGDVLGDAGAASGSAIILGSEVRSSLKAICLADLSNGGRGIRNKIEAHLVNPLARALFDAAPPGDGSILIQEIQCKPGGTTTLLLAQNKADAA